MSGPITHSNISNDIAVKYLIVNEYKNTNSAGDEFSIDYKKLDTETKGELKQAIAHALDNYIRNYSMNDHTKEELQGLFKSNMGPNIHIEYSKLRDSDCDVDLERNLRETIQLILIKRARELYLYMTMNPTV